MWLVMPAASPARSTASIDADGYRCSRTARVRNILAQPESAYCLCADHGQPARRSPGAGQACTHARRPGDCQHFRQPHAVRIPRGLPALPQRPEEGFELSFFLNIDMVKTKEQRENLIAYWNQLSVKMRQVLTDGKMVINKFVRQRSDVVRLK